MATLREFDLDALLSFMKQQIASRGFYEWGGMVCNECHVGEITGKAELEHRRLTTPSEELTQAVGAPPWKMYLIMWNCSACQMNADMRYMVKT